MQKLNQLREKKSQIPPLWDGRSTERIAEKLNEIFFGLMYTMILDGEYPNDIRVRKEAESLADSGIKIQVVTRWKKGQARKEMIKWRSGDSLRSSLFFS